MRFAFRYPESLLLFLELKIKMPGCWPEINLWEISLTYLIRVS